MGGILVQGYTLGSVDEEVVITSIFAAAREAMVARAPLGELSG